MTILQFIVDLVIIKTSFNFHFLPSDASSLLIFKVDCTKKDSQGAINMIIMQKFIEICKTKRMIRKRVYYKLMKTSFYNKRQKEEPNCIATYITCCDFYSVPSFSSKECFYMCVCLCV